MPLEITRNSLLIKHISDPDTLDSGVSRDERDLLLFSLRGETEKIENWIKGHKGETLPTHDWLAEKSTLLPANAMQMAFLYAAATGQERSMHCITDNAAIDVNRPYHTDGRTLLHLMAGERDSGCRIPALASLLELGADPTLKTNNGNTPADLARSCGLYETAAVLQELADQRQTARNVAQSLAQKTRFERNIDRLDSLLGPHKTRKTP